MGLNITWALWDVLGRIERLEEERSDRK